MKRIFSLFLLLFLTLGVSPINATRIPPVPSCEYPAEYKFTWSGKDYIIEHCGRENGGARNFSIRVPVNGELWVYFRANSETKMSVTSSNGSRDKWINGTGIWKTGIDFVSGDSLTFTADMGDSPLSGWIDPKGDVCNGFEGAGNLNVAQLRSDALNDGTKLFSTQCWGDGYAYENLLHESYDGYKVNISCSGNDKDCHDVMIEDMDFNDSAFFLAVKPKDHTSSCDDLAIISGNYSTVPGKVKFEAKATDNLGNIQNYRFIFGDGERSETTDRQIEHTYESSGNFNPLVEVKDSQGRWITSSNCQEEVTINSSNIESHKSACSYLNIGSGQRSQAPVTAKLTVGGYDNKGSIQAYRLDFGDGETEERSDRYFEHYYAAAGTYALKAEVKDSNGNWITSDDCSETLYVSTEPVTEQPSTGTPTLFTLTALFGGVGAGAYPLSKGFRNLAKGKNKKRR